MLTDDLQVYAPKAAATHPLLENETSWESPGRRLLDCWYAQDTRYLCVMYDTVNIVIDREERKMAARYAGHFARGCLIGDVYHIASDEGIRKVAFPLIEAMPQKNQTFLLSGIHTL